MQRWAVSPGLVFDQLQDIINGAMPHGLDIIDAAYPEPPAT
jgi:hypothetical protein